MKYSQFSFINRKCEVFLFDMYEWGGEKKLVVWIWKLKECILKHEGTVNLGSNTFKSMGGFFSEMLVSLTKGI